MSNSVFFQSPRHYKQYTHALRNLIYSSTDTERFLQKHDSSICLYPVVIDNELTNLGMRDGQTRLMGFNYHHLGGIEHFVAYALTYHISRRFALPFFFNGYLVGWSRKEYDNFVKIHTHKASSLGSSDRREYQAWLYKITTQHIEELFNPK